MCRSPIGEMNRSLDCAEAVATGLLATYFAEALGSQAAWLRSPRGLDRIAESLFREMRIHEAQPPVRSLDSAPAERAA